jgi:hypothetical protein
MTEIPTESDHPLFWQACYRRDVEACELLVRHYSRLKDGELKSALWEAIWSLRDQARRTVESAVSRGQLLMMFLPGAPSVSFGFWR